MLLVSCSSFEVSFLTDRVSTSRKNRKKINVEIIKQSLKDSNVENDFCLT